jgi:sterol desaturase/sphingolipid hydroxylase (fatty acid hydroxylase superfamily)
VLSTLFLEPVKALVVAAAVFVPFERLAAAHPEQPTLRRGWATDVLTGLMNGLLLYAALMIALSAIDSSASAVAPGVRARVEMQPLWAQAILALVLGDLGVYASHRLSHTVPWLWRFHAVHHSAEEMDWLVGFRFHPIDLLLLRVASLGPLVALHVTPAAIAIFIAVSGWQAWLVHANVRVPYGPLRWLVVSPEFHHWHHATERDAYDKNFASLVASWDVLFGTVHLPRGRRPSSYGIDDRVPDGWVARLFHPYRRTEHDDDRSQSPQVPQRTAATENL